MAATETAALAKFTIKESDDGYSLHIEDDAGGVLELKATAEQLDLIAESVEDLLDDDDAADLVEDADEED